MELFAGDPRGQAIATLAHGIRQQVAHLSITTGPVVRGVDVVWNVECTLLDADGQWRGEAVSLALSGVGAVAGARSGGGDCVDHELINYTDAET